MTVDFDLIVIGSGPAGYVAAIRAAQLGMKTACVEKWKDEKGKLRLGGTCLNVGCIPSKALLEASHNYHDTKHAYIKQGISCASVDIDVKEMIAYKDGIVNGLVSGVQGLFKHNKVETLEGEGYLLPNKQVRVKAQDGTEKVFSAKHIILANGSIPVELSIAKFDHKSIVDSSGALAFQEVPKKLCIVGAGVIGLELGSVWARLGSEVVILEASETFLPPVDRALATSSFKIFSKSLDIKLGAKLTGSELASDGTVTVHYEDKGEAKSLLVDKMVVAVGRKPNTQNAFDPAAGIKLNDRGFVEVDQFCSTGTEGIYAVGDIVRGPMLAHKGSEEGIMVVERLHGEPSEVNYETIPNVIYTSPEISWVGKTEEELKQAGVDYKVGQFPFAASGRAMANNNTQGMVKLLSDKKTDRILGVHVLGEQAGEMIAQAVIAMEFHASTEDIALTMFAHPTLSEAFHESALAADGHAIHIPNKK